MKKNEQTNLEESGQFFYHGTTRLAAHAILTQGFKLDYEYSGRGWGNGVYLSGTHDFALFWGSIVITCRLKKSARILWHDKHNRKIIAYLKKEFGTGITRPDFHKVIPANKQLKKNEIIAVWNYLLEKNYHRKRVSGKDGFPFFQKNYPYIYEHLKRHQFDGVGFREDDWPEILIFNPSMIQPLSAHWATDEKQTPLPLEFIKSVRDEFAGFNGLFTVKYRSFYNHTIFSKCPGRISFAPCFCLRSQSATSKPLNSSLVS